MKFTLQHKDPSSQARAGELQTDHGVVKTPIFMPVGTAATVKGVFRRDVRDEARTWFVLFGDQNKEMFNFGSGGKLLPTLFREFSATPGTGFDRKP